MGNVLAVLLGQLGRSVLVLERQPDPYPLPRAVHFDHEVGRILQSCGIGGQLRPLTEPGEIYEWRNAEGRTLLRFGRIGDGPSGWPLSSMFNQPTLEGLLAGRAAEIPTVEVRRGVEVVGLDQDSEGVTLRTAVHGGIRVRYAVGCDGANSTVASLLGLPFCDLGYFFDWLVVDVILHGERVFDPVNLQICDPARPTTAVSGGPGRRRWEFMRLPEEPLEELGREERAWELLSPWEVHPGNARLERHAVYTFRARYAERWREGRVFVAGDAAHLTPPFAGQGLCAGVRDAANLAWKLDMVLAGHAPESVLDTYQQERLPSARTAIEFSVELGRVICVPDPVEAAGRDEAMAAAVGAEPADVPDLPGPTGGLIHPTARHAGELSVQPRVGDGLFDDVHGVGWRLVTTAGDVGQLDPAARSWFGTIGGQIVVVDPGDAVLDSWLTSRGVTWALQRPDFWLYGTAVDAPGASTLIANLRDRITGRNGMEGSPA